jgi:hypothetical protein
VSGAFVVVGEVSAENPTRIAKKYFSKVYVATI